MAELEADKRRWPDPETGPWELEGRYSPIGGRFELVGLSLKPMDADHPEPLTSTLLRGLVPSRLMAEHRDQARAALAAYLAETARPGWADYISDEQAERQQQLFHGSAVDPERKRPGRPPYWQGDRLREVAGVYNEAVERQERPSKAVAERLHISRSLAKKLAARCRELGWIPPVRGKAR